MGYKLKRATMRPNGVEKQVRPRGGGGWQPGVNTLLYLPLESDVVDMSGKTGRTFSTSSISYTTVGGIQSIHVGTSGGVSLTAPKPIANHNTTEQTISILVYNTTNNTSGYWRILEFAIQNSMYIGLFHGKGKYRYSNSISSRDFNDMTLNERHHIVITCKNNTRKFYIDGTPAQTSSATDNSYTRGNWSPSYEQNQSIFNARDGLSASQGLRGNARELIIEQIEWTAQEVADYYTWIKSKLGF